MPVLACLAALPLLLPSLGTPLAAVQKPDLSLWVPQSDIATFRYSAIPIELRKRISALVVPVFSGGRPTIKLKVSAAKPAPLDLVGIVRAAAADSVPVYGYVSVLDWSSSKDRGGFKKEWYEQSSDYAFEPTSSYGFAGIHQPGARSYLLGSVSAISNEYPGLTGLILGFQMPRAPLFAHSVAAREASLRATGIDPVDLDIDGMTDSASLASDPKTGEQVRRFMDWRLASYATFLKELSSAARGVSSPKTVGLLIDADLYQYDQRRQIGSAQDWFNAAPSAGIRDVYFLASPTAFADQWRSLMREGTLAKEPLRFSALLGDGVRSVDASEESSARTIVREGDQLPRIFRFFTAGGLR